ncbi:imidazole glycerol phosphate synthase subunit HisH [Candidatus Marinimicrobia bacterium MT.SAG.2]|nr:imidazole glycerol phosphate synthase subunit HisH [Candidatus Marinimicrobia bacterium MT.SAG.2]
MIAIIDYNSGNVKAFANIYKNLNIPHLIATKPGDLDNATKLILPGVGSFDYAMMQLDNSGMRESLDELVLKRKMPVLGICVGMQMLAHSSEEGSSAGLGWIDGVVKKLDPSTMSHKTRLPHMGWNNVVPSQTSKLFNKLEDNPRFYFLHSFYFSCSNEDNVIAVTEYGTTFASSVNSENVFGLQCHPEKSHQNGIQFLENFASL